MIIFNGNLYQSEKKIFHISNLNLYKQILNCFSYCKQKPAWIIEIEKKRYINHEAVL